MRILFVALLHNPGASGRQRIGAFRALGHDVYELATDPFDRRGPIESRVRERLLRRWPFRSADQRALGQTFVDVVKELRPDVVWVEKAILLTAPSVRAAKQAAPDATFVCFQDDDPFGMRTRDRPTWSSFVAAISSYDVQFVKREANLEEFARHGAKRVMTVMHGVYAPLFHPPADLDAARARDLVFVGTPLDHRVGTIDALLNRHGLPLQVLGHDWPRSLPGSAHRARLQPAVYNEAYAAVLRSAKIALAFVSSSNRDEYSMRTFEIPACGAMLLAERTPVHARLFEEGVEAEFFADAAECADKCRYYLGNDAARVRIARAGLAKASRPEYSLETQLREALARARAR